MNVEAIKLNLIEWLARLQDESMIKKLMELKEETEGQVLEPLTKEDLIQRAEEANRDIEAGRVFPIEEVMKEDWD
ncbi:MAG: hypothetical protein H6557_34080 [Lewinellaceae bacterium]|nr:hypothetical protein [Phaeodactylibacter sp.]MCB9041671.1 hypothetical protein [Lewinellaceae bacterium]